MIGTIRHDLVCARVAFAGAIMAAFLLSSCFLKGMPFNSERFEQEKQKEVNDLISKSPDLQQLAALCERLGSLQNFKLKGRSMSTHGQPALYYYFGSKAPYESTRQAFSNFLLSDGWQPVESLSVNETFSFTKNKMQTTVQFGGIGDADYSITCEMVE